MIGAAAAVNSAQRPWRRRNPAPRQNTRFDQLDANATKDVGHYVLVAKHPFGHFNPHCDIAAGFEALGVDERVGQSVVSGFHGLPGSCQHIALGVFHFGL